MNDAFAMSGRRMSRRKRRRRLTRLSASLVASAGTLALMTTMGPLFDDGAASADEQTAAVSVSTPVPAAVLPPDRDEEQAPSGLAFALPGGDPPPPVPGGPVPRLAVPSGPRLLGGFSEPAESVSVTTTTTTTTTTVAPRPSAPATSSPAPVATNPPPTSPPATTVPPTSPPPTTVPPTSPPPTTTPPTTSPPSTAPPTTAPPPPPTTDVS